MKNFFVLSIFLLSNLLYAQTKAIITVDTLNVRESPNGTKFDHLEKNTSVLFIEKQGEWSHILYDNNKTGWVSSKFITVEKETEETEEKIPNTSNIKMTTICEIENKTKAKVCILHKEPKLECFGSTCDVIFNYEIATNYKGDGLIYADLDFSADIKLPDGKIKDRVEQTGHNFYKLRKQKEKIKVQFYLKGGIEIDKIELSKSKVSITGIKFYD